MILKDLTQPEFFRVSEFESLLKVRNHVQKRFKLNLGWRIRIFHHG